MSLKSLSQTRWKIGPDRVVVYPFGTFYILTAVTAVLLTGIMLLYIRYQNATGLGTLPFGLLILFIVVLFWGFAGTNVEFDRPKARMCKRFMGFLPVKTIPFSELQGISPVSNTAGTYNYRLFRKDAKYGQGIVVSSGYTRNDDPNASAFVDEAVRTIHGYLDQYDTPADFDNEFITNYRFFDQQGNVYTIKNRKIGGIIMGLLFIALGLYLTRIDTNGMLAKIAIVAAMIFLGLIFINAAFTKITFDTAAKTIERTGLVKLFYKQYQFGSFAGIQTLRRSVNLVYAGTDVNMYFEPGNGKQEILTASSFRNSADIERFIREVYQIMGIA